MKNRCLYIMRRGIVLVIVSTLIVLRLHAQKGTLIITGGSFTKEGIKSFVEKAGGPNAKYIFVPSASSGIKLPSGYIWEPADSSKTRIDSFEIELAKMFGVKKITLLHTTDSKKADSKLFCAPLETANGVWLGPGNAGRYASIFIGTKFEKSLKDLLERGGVIAGNSAGAIIQGSYIVRGRPDKPVLMASGNEKGFGFLKDVVINPHLFSAKRETELVNVLDRYPELLGIGLDDETTLIVSDNVMEIHGKAPVYIYDNFKHEKNWWYELPAECKFSLNSRKLLL
jgi:cyanophycinase